MSEVVLASRYAALNYPLALENLSKRFRSKDGNDPVNYTEVGFGDLSEDQAAKALRFFGDIGLLENPKGADYIPPQAVLDWMLKMGNTAEEGEQQVRDILQDYDVFSELTFILAEGDEKLDDLAEQVGGLVGIDEDELSDMKKTIEVFAACGLLEINEDNTVNLAAGSTDSSGAEEPTQQQLPDGAVATDGNPSTPRESPATDGTAEHEPKPNRAPTHSVAGTSSQSIDLEISINATDMEPDDLREKLDIIEEFTNDGE